MRSPRRIEKNGRKADKGQSIDIIPALKCSQGKWRPLRRPERSHLPVGPSCDLVENVVKTQGRIDKDT